MNVIDVTGHRYGRLVALEFVWTGSRRRHWLFACDCGTQIVAPLERVRGGVTKSCGCLRKEVTRQRSITHGHKVGRAETRTYKSYSHAKGRCFNPKDPKHVQYGGRGITMCERWADDFSNFLADMGECPEGKTLDRIDPNGNYEPGNCRWATSRQQARTRTDNVLVIHEGKTLILKDFADVMGVRYKALHALVKYKRQTPHEAALALMGG